TISLSLPYSLLRTPPASALFPYTTLFRSDPRRGRERQSRRIGRCTVEHHDAQRRHEQAPTVAQVVAKQEASFGGDIRRRKPPASDRKSTRLNSSHLVISYAVFRLKKKQAY